MKKIVNTLCIATLCAFAANAAAPQTERVAISKAKSSKAVQTQEFIQTMPSDAKIERVTPAPRHASKATKAEDYVGIYKWTSTNGLQGATPMPNEGFFSIVLDPEKENGLILNDFPMYFATHGNFDPASGRLYIPNQVLEEEYETDEEGNQHKFEYWFWNYTAYNVDIPPAEGGGHGYKFKQNYETEFFFLLNADGTIQSYDVTKEQWENFQLTDQELLDNWCAAAVLPFYDDKQDVGFYLLSYWVDGDPITEYEVDMDQWEPIGDALFKDAWWPVMWENGQVPQAYNVPLYRNNKTRTEYMLFNPYGPETIYGMDGVNVSDANGYIIFDIADPYCVVFRPLVYSITINMMNDNEEMYEEGCYTYNLEGQFFYITGMSTIDIMNMLDTEGFLTSDLRASSRTITVRNPLIAYKSNPTEGIWWGGQQYQDFKGTIQLPDGYNAIGSIVDDSKNGEPVYYNLQGVRVENPEKGQLVIVKKGGKAEKMIVR